MAPLDRAIAVLGFVLMAAVVVMLLAARLATRKPRHDAPRNISNSFHNDQHRRAMKAALVQREN